MSKIINSKFNTQIAYSGDPLAEMKLEQVFQYILNINNKQDEKQRTCVPEEGQGH